ncbi:MAG: peptidoglycan DD-metalloendopeptidase family protein [Gammaproteobacteria bacterium]|nr:peptidoglycan DD-metalloendopeptidase family protein [Gammaproteobacteria bacterium]
MGRSRPGGGRVLRPRFEPLKSALCTILGATWLVQACGGSAIVPVVDHSPSPNQPTSRAVRAGDTLYSIAWEAGIDFRVLASWNGIRSPYVIKVGEKIRLTPPPSDEPQQIAIPKAPSQPQAQPRKVTIDDVPVNPPRGWGWPANGPIVRRFSLANGNKGIDIGGQTGAAVKAAASGRVVYAGSGLRGYGRLIIIKHDETFLSAYAHNRKVFVKEGDNVPRGYKIAEMGSSGVDRVKLHFEIRRRGAPVDPLGYLPKR